MAMTSSSSNYYVPEDVVIEILSWLEPKSLVRFKSVCKHWYSLITCLIKYPKFVAKHLNNAHTNITLHAILQPLLISRPVGFEYSVKLI